MSGERGSGGVVPHITHLCEDLGCDQCADTRDCLEVCRLPAGQLLVDVVFQVRLLLAQGIEPAEGGQCQLGSGRVGFACLEGRLRARPNEGRLFSGPVMVW